MGKPIRLSTTSLIAGSGQTFSLKQDLWQLRLLKVFFVSHFALPPNLIYNNIKKGFDAHEILSRIDREGLFGG